HQMSFIANAIGNIIYSSMSEHFRFSSPINHLFSSMYSNSDFDSSLDASALQEVSNDGSCDIGSTGSKKSEQPEISSLFAPWNTSKMSTMSDNGKTREVLEDDEEYIDNRIYISNIPFSYTSVDLEKIFSSYGKVISAQVVTNERGSKGFGFVTLDTGVGCDLAREGLDGSIMGGRKIEVKKARQMQHGRPFPGGYQPKVGNARSLLSPSLLYPAESAALAGLPAILGDHGFNPLAAMQGLSNPATVQLMAQMHLAQLQSMQTAHLLNILSSQQQSAAMGVGMGQSGLPLPNPLLNSLMNPLAMTSPINPFGMDTSLLLRQNANLSGFTQSMVNQTDPLASLFPSLDSTPFDSLNGAFIRQGGVVPSSSGVSMGGVTRMMAPPSLSFEASTNRKRGALESLVSLAPKNGRFV
ncbi:hypothetical protein PFISCL1PPCAC_5768, partial [Pristionchus fissidentatus]